MMRIYCLLLMAGCLVASVCYAQITLSGKDMTFPHLFKQIRKQTGYRFVYNNNMLPQNKRIDVSVKDASINTILDKYLRPVMLTYEIRPDKTIIIRQLKEESPLPASPAGSLLQGQVTNENGEPLPGATIAVKGTRIGATSDGSGNFTLTVPHESTVILVSFVGHLPREIQPWNGHKIIQLTTTIKTMGDVTITTGMFHRNKTIFSGATATFTGQELRRIGTLNILESLKTLDPSFLIIPNNIAGSNPNQIPRVEVRGKTGLSSNTVRDQFSNDPNQPLFILNGMETTLQQIIDLDMNRVASVTLLKDAASTALYGSRAANGVVVVETVRPKPGELRISYSTTMRLEAPVLGDYNMMNAAELLEFQRLSGLYEPGFYAGSINNDNLYNQRLAEVVSGVNSYWLTAPLRNSFTQAHSVNAGGGNNEFQYNIGLNYRGLNGVMKGSDRKTAGAMIDLNYQRGKIKVANSLYINGADANESPYGAFSDYVKLSPYYRKKKADGSLNTDRYLEVFRVVTDNNDFDTLRVANPLYNTRLGGENNTTSLLLQDLLNLIYDVAPSWRISGGFQLAKNSGKSVVFVPSDNTQFEGMAANQKGQYTETRTDAFSYQGNLMLTYRKVLNEVHSINGNLRSEIQEQGQTVTGFSAVGFPSGVRPNPANAGSYPFSSKPVFQKTKARRVNALASINYAYKSRYYIDATYRLDGSTVFGSEKKYAPFWSIGAGWNVSNELEVQKLTWLNNLRIRANIGMTGNQSLGTYVSTSVFGFEKDNNVFGQGLYMQQLGNPLLQWQRTRSTNIGLDAGLWNNRLMATIDVYEKYTNPLVVVGTKPASVGVATYAFNVGSLLSRGVEANIHFSPVYKQEKNIQWTLGVMGAFYKSRYGGFSNLLKNLNDSALQYNSLQRYLDGYGPDELWAVRSLGIDPVSGQELFLKKDGTHTFIYDPADISPVGDGRPLVQGVVSSNFTYKGFRLGINLRYSVRQLIMNQALYSKVENISFADLANNQDKRALALRWKQPGDQAAFKGISITDNTPISSRFLQHESYLSGESISTGYEMYANKHRWMHRCKLQGLRLELIMNDVFRLSTIQSERGIEYPFSKAVSFNLNAFF
ncbi:SusC/RagA family TonB-linked outer membrane protein [Chitinophaga qingshengii]|uniref:SusC/RagA family TonB-linked outer membrane protein n=1 Tax=Chitinophaga qingshengii TaxID=1569794 RepID=A0ABR7THN6_9BACT|nr:SusC/RagA family TonB-linked outer membrane protein [Chitinophaga qingshengii]MBC9930006.1 SusC/RagA family TonB-linked outer membrane protein [Chitinophaga qingshengii]